MPKNLTDVSNFDSPVSVPVDTDAANAASVEAPFQQLADRTRFLKNKFDSSTGRVNIVNDAAASPTMVDIYSGSDMISALPASGIPDWKGGQGLLDAVAPNVLDDSWISVADGGVLFCSILKRRPRDGTLVSVDVHVKPGNARATASHRMQFQVIRLTGGGGSAWTMDRLVLSGAVTHVTDDGTANNQKVTLTISGGEDYDDTARYYVQILSSDNDAVAHPDQVNAVYVHSTYVAVP